MGSTASTNANRIAKQWPQRRLTLILLPEEEEYKRARIRYTTKERRARLETVMITASTRHGVKAPNPLAYKTHPLHPSFFPPTQTLPLSHTRPQSSNPHHHHQQQQQPSSLKIPNPSEICLTTPILKTLSKSFLPKNPNQSPADSCPL
jgi:hypothetical protein